METAGLDGAMLCVVEIPYGIDEGAAAFTQILQQQARTTAVFCGNDVLAVGALRAARTLGISVPDDVSISGFDDIDLSVVTHPPLTTVHVPHRKMGRQAAQALVGMVLDGETAKAIELATTPTLRDSLRAPTG